MTAGYTIVLAGTAVDAWGEQPDGRLWGNWRWLDCSPEVYTAIEHFQELPPTLLSPRGEVIVTSHPYFRKGDILRLAQA